MHCFKALIAYKLVIDIGTSEIFLKSVILAIWQKYVTWAVNTDIIPIVKLELAYFPLIGMVIGETNTSDL